MAMAASCLCLRPLLSFQSSSTRRAYPSVQASSSSSTAERDGSNGAAVHIPLHNGKSGAQIVGKHEHAMSMFLFSLLGPFSTLPAMAESSSGPGYSLASYYTSLGLFVLSVPGLWSLIKRSTKSKIVKKTFEIPGPENSAGREPKQIAGEITSLLTRSNFSVVDRGEVVTFEGTMVPSRGQAAFLTFCTCLSLASVALVLTITVPEVGDKWYWLTGLSPLAGVYYWTRASRKEQIKVKMVLADDGSSTDIIIQGDDEQVDMLRKELGFMEKGMVYVKGILER